MSIFSNIPTLFTDTLKDEKLQDVTIELSEAVLDSVLDDGLFKDIFGLSTIIGILKTRDNYSDRAFLKKILYFISNVNDISAEERDKMISDIDDSMEYKVKVGEKLLYIIDKCDDHEKAQIIGALFKSFLAGLITYDDFLGCALVIEKCLVKDLKYFVRENIIKYKIKESSELLNWGLLEVAPLELKLKKNNGGGLRTNSEYTLENKELFLSVSASGKLIRTHLLEYVKNEFKEIKINVMNLDQINNYIEKNLNKSHKSNYSERRRLHAMDTIAELCNNWNITDEEFYNLASDIIVNIHSAFIVSVDRHIIELNREEVKNGNDFNFKRWEKFDIRFRTKHKETGPFDSSIQDVR